MPLPAPETELGLVCMCICILCMCVVCVCFRPICFRCRSTPFGISGRSSRGWSEILVLGKNCRHSADFVVSCENSTPSKNHEVPETGDVDDVQAAIVSWTSMNHRSYIHVVVRESELGVVAGYDRNTVYSMYSVTSSDIM